MADLVSATAGAWLCTLCAAIGGVTAPILVRDWFGHAGVCGIIYALVGGLMATMLLGVFAGTLILPVFGTMFGPLLVLTASIAKPWFLLPWVISLKGLHSAMVEYRAEQDTIYRWLPRIDTT
ncbi:MAG: hypothetical protein AAGA47_06315 [Pseudomonadota bacterium]